MEKQDLIGEYQKQITSLKLENSTLRIKNNGLSVSLSTEVRVSEELRKNNANLAVKNDRQKKAIKTQSIVLYVVSSLAIIEFFVIAIM